MRVVLRAVLSVLLIALGLAQTSGPASALSCKDPTSVASSADHVFTGAITDVHDGRVQVAVEEIWKGGPLAARVSLATELDGWWDGMGNGHLPDGYRSHSTWLFMSRDDQHGTQVVGPCSAWPKTRPWGKDLRPVSVMASDGAARSLAIAAALGAIGR